MADPKSLFRAAADAWRRRRRACAAPAKWRGLDVAREVREQVRAAEDAGLLDPALLDDFEAELVLAVEARFDAELAPMRPGIGRGVAEAAFGGTLYANRLDRQLATGASAVAEVVLEERLVLVASALSLRAAFDVAELVPPRLPARVGSTRAADLAP